LILLLLFGLLPVAGVHAVDAEEVHSGVKYLSSSMIYLTSGREQGVEIGNNGEVRRGGAVISRFEVVYVADNSCSARPDSSGGAIVVGDEAIIFIVHHPAVDSVTKAEPVELMPVESQPPRPVQHRKQERINRLSGYVAVQGAAQDDLSSYNYDYQEPSLIVRSRIENIHNTHLTATVRLHARRTFRNQQGITTSWENRLYELSLVYENEESPWYAGFGRLIPVKVSNAGYLDGLLWEYDVTKRLIVGGFAGAEPDYATSRIQTDQRKAGLYAYYQAGDYQTRYVSGTVALVGRYTGSQISSETVYQQADASWGGKWWLSQSAELQINRGWRQKVTGKSLELGNFQSMIRYSPVAWWDISVGYDNFTATRTFDTKDTPDSLFDAHIRQGAHLGVNFNLLSNCRLYADGSLRSEEGGYAKSGSFGAGCYNVLKSGVGVSASVNMFSNQYSQGWQPYVTVSRIFFDDLSVNLQGGLSSHSIAGGNSMSDNWGRISGDYNLPWNSYIGGAFEVYRGNELKTNRMSVEMGVRF